MPWSLRLLREIVVEVRTDLLTQVIQPGRFSSPETGLTFHIRERSLNGELAGLIMHDARNPQQMQSYLAERGIIVEQNGTAYLVMTDGHILRARPIAPTRRRSSPSTSMPSTSTASSRRRRPRFPTSSRANATSASS